MSDHSISIIPNMLRYENPEDKAIEILAWLVATEVVRKDRSNCILGNEGGYKPSIGAKAVLLNPGDLHLDLAINGLEIVTTKTVFHAGEYGLDYSVCPYCNHNNIKTIFNAMEDWYTKDIAVSQCSSCLAAVSLESWQCTPDWGFSNLGFIFWNWPMFTDNFIHDFAHKLGVEAKVIHQHL